MSRAPSNDFDAASSAQSNSWAGSKPPKSIVFGNKRGRSTSSTAAIDPRHSRRAIRQGAKRNTKPPRSSRRGKSTQSRKVAPLESNYKKEKTVPSPKSTVVANANENDWDEDFTTESNWTGEPNTQGDNEESYKLTETWTFQPLIEALSSKEPEQTTEEQEAAAAAEKEAAAAQVVSDELRKAEGKENPKLWEDMYSSDDDSSVYTSSDSDLPKPRIMSRISESFSFIPRIGSRIRGQGGLRSDRDVPSDESERTDGSQSDDASNASTESDGEEEEPEEYLSFSWVGNDYFSSTDEDECRYLEERGYRPQKSGADNAYDDTSSAPAENKQKRKTMLDARGRKEDFSLPYPTRSGRVNNFNEAAPWKPYHGDATLESKDSWEESAGSGFTGRASGSPSYLLWPKQRKIKTSSRNLSYDAEPFSMGL
mmetsp:Transcript_21514/g.44873  ORF Transcript_21514/g.44873 Transcript_21514/m.44873 type:complete len:425 (-) Transcript_21514:92-1366(-)